MRKIAAGLIVIPLGLLLVALAVVNREPITLGLNPLDSAAGVGIEAPFFLFLLAAFALGLIVGGAATWFGQAKWRQLARSRAREASALRNQADRLERELEFGRASRPARLGAD